MKRINLLSAVKWAVLFFVVNTLTAIGAYLVWCSVYDTGVCSVRSGTYWIRMHPIFPDFILYFPILGFVIGAIAHLLPEFPLALKNIVGWVVVILLIAVLALWGLPNFGR